MLYRGIRLKPTCWLRVLTNTGNFDEDVTWRLCRLGLNRKTKRFMEISFFILAEMTLQC